MSFVGEVEEKEVSRLAGDDSAVEEVEEIAADVLRSHLEARAGDLDGVRSLFAEGF